MNTLLKIFLLCALPGACAPAAAQNLIFADSVLQVGDLAENDPPRTYRFTFENRSDRPVVILRVDTSCGCVKSSFDRKPVAPGMRGEIRLTLDPRGHAGALYKTMPVYTSEPGRQPAIRLALSGVIRPRKP